MKYLIATFTINGKESLLQAARDLLADTAAEAGFEAFEDTSTGIKAYVQEALFNKDKLDDSLSDFLMPEVRISYTLSKAEDKDWNEAWEQAGFEPIDVQHRLLIVDANSKEETCKIAENKHNVDNPYKIIVRIAARQAFGTGTHQTTQMIVTELLDLQMNGKRVLDCGCGTGILSIVASLLGADETYGYDIDKWSVENALYNAQLNKVNNLKVLLGDATVLKTIQGQFDIVLANINRNILLQDLPVYYSKMKANALLILSGFYTEDLPLLVDKAQTLGLSLIRQQSKDDWCCAVFGC